MDYLERITPLRFFLITTAFFLIFSIIGAYGWQWIDCLDGLEPRYSTVPVVFEDGNIHYIAVEDGVQVCD